MDFRWTQSSQSLPRRGQHLPGFRPMHVHGFSEKVARQEKRQPPQRGRRHSPTGPQVDRLYVVRIRVTQRTLPFMSRRRFGNQGRSVDHHRKHGTPYDPLVSVYFDRKLSSWPGDYAALEHKEKFGADLGLLDDTEETESPKHCQPRPTRWPFLI